MWLTAIVAVVLVVYIVTSSDKKLTGGEAKSIRVASNELIIRAGTAESKAVPDVVGRYWSDFAPELMALGWRGLWSKGRTSPRTLQTSIAW